MKGTVKRIVLVALTLGLNAQAALANPVDLNLLGAASAEALRNNGAQVEMTPSDGAYSVRITMPSKLEHAFGSPKLDQFSLDKEVTFKLSENPDGTVRLSNIKGFKIHSVEKQMWVNLYGVDFGAPDAQGQHESVISAGKMGVVKQVPTSISPKTYEPISGFIASIHGGASPTSPTSPTNFPIAGQQDSGQTAASQPTFSQVPTTPSVVTPPVTTAGAVPPSQGWNDPNPAQNPYGTASGASGYGGLAGSGVTAGAPSTYTPSQPTTVQPSFSQPPTTYTPPQTSTPPYSSSPAYSTPAYTPPAYTPPVQTTSYPSTSSQADVPTTTRVYSPPPDAGVTSSFQNPSPSTQAPNSYGNGNGNVGVSGGSSSNQGILQEAVGRVKKVLDDDDDDDDDDDREEMRRKQQRQLQQQQNRSNRRDDDDDDDGD